jgi:DNA-binding transcriptional regulator YiaG
MQSEDRNRVERMDSAVRTLFFWRQKNGLSQAGAVVFLQTHRFDLTLSTLRAWERGRRRPRSHSRELLEHILREFPTAERKAE